MDSGMLKLTTLIIVVIVAIFFAVYKTSKWEDLLDSEKIRVIIVIICCLVIMVGLGKLFFFN